MSKAIDIKFGAKFHISAKLTKKNPEKGRGVGHVTIIFLAFNANCSNS